jgi:ABC-2 type transport system permease protein
MTGACDAGVLFVCSPKWRAGRRRIGGGGLVRGAVLGAVALVFWAMLFTLMTRMLTYFQRQPGIGDVLAEELLALVLLTFLSILLFSNVITALSSFFLARDLELLAAAPIDGLRFYAARLLETMLNSSWMVLIVLLPVLVAYGVVYDAGPLYLLVSLLATAAFLLLAAVLGTALTQVLVNVFPAKRARDLLALLGLLAGATLLMLLRLMRPERLAKPEGFRDLVDFVAALEAPGSAWLPSDWAARAIVAPLRAADAGPDLFPLLLLASTAAAAFVFGAWLHGRLYAEGFTKSQGGGTRERAARTNRGLMELTTRALPITARSLVAKEVRTFFRDTTQWSQLILLGVLVVVYVYNVKALPLFSGENVGFFLVNVVAFLNLGLAGFVLAAIAARFLFPAVSLEGRALWLLRSSPLRMSSLLWSKFWVGIIPLVGLALALTIGTNRILHVTGFVMVLSVGTMVVVTFALGSLALGFGALFPKFDTENTADIPMSFGGLLFMMTAVAYLTLVIVLEAWPVYGVLRARFEGRPLGAEHWVSMAGGLGAALAISILAIILPLKAAVRRVEALDR